MGGFSNVLNAKIAEQLRAKKVETDLLGLPDRAQSSTRAA